MKPRIVIIAGDHDTLPMVYNALKERFEVVGVIVERPVSRTKLFKWRTKKYGFISALGQALFVILIQPILALTSKKRTSEIIAQAKLQKDQIPPELCTQVNSINSDESINELIKHNPDYVIVHGTRIISKKVLAATKAIFINIHAGITPRYRGSHGGYWALG